MKWIWLARIFVLFPVYWMGENALFAQGNLRYVWVDPPAPTRAAISNIRAESTSHQGIATVKVIFDLNSSGLGCRDSDTTVKKVSIIAWLLDEKERPVYRAETKAVDFSNTAGVLAAITDTIKISTSSTIDSRDTTRKEIQLNFPAYQLNLPEGEHRLVPVITVSAEGDKKCREQMHGNPISFFKQATSLFTFKLEFLMMDTTGSGGGVWDFALFNSKEKPPDLEWLLFRGDELLFKSIPQRNHFYYEATETDTVSWFLLTRGDKVTLHIRDYDVTSFSDEVGKLTFDPLAQKDTLNLRSLAPFGYVKNCLYSVSSAPKPELAFSNSKFKWQAGGNLPAGRQFQSGYSLKSETGTKNTFVSIVSQQGKNFAFPPFEKSRDLRSFPKSKLFEITVPGREMKIEIPHYSLGDSIEQMHPKFLLVSGQWMGQRIFHNPPLELPGMKIPSLAPGMNEIGISLKEVADFNSEGISAKRLIWSFSLPADYLQDLPLGKISFIPKVMAGNREVKLPSSLSIQFSSLKNLKPTSDGKVNFDLHADIPVFKLPFPGQVNVLDISGEAFILEKPGTEEFKAGTSYDSVSIPVPTLIRSSLALESASVTDTKIKGKPVYWTIFLGNYQTFLSSTVPGNLNMAWKETADFLCIPGDSVTILVVNNEQPFQPVWIGKWSGKIEQLLGEKGEKIILKGEGIKKLKIRIG